jgi:predicted membrane channel-forming protein YqfA (hemolysin III family)
VSQDPMTGASRYDRELIELLNELRVVLPGVQVLFAFLLPVPFTQRWTEVDAFGRNVFFVTLLLAAAATALLIAPSAFHRIRFRRRDKRHMLAIANGFAIAGLLLLAAAMTGAVLLVSDLLFTRGAAITVAALTGGVFLLVWFAVPLSRWLNDRDRDRRAARREDGDPGDGVVTRGTASV